jgi:DNA processing protein
MTGDLFSSSTASADFAQCAMSPRRELGAYEALWAQEGTSFKSLARDFRAHPGAIPSDFVSNIDIEKHARLAPGAIRDAGIKHFGVRIHGAGEYPESLRDAEHAIELLYFQCAWELVNRLTQPSPRLSIPSFFPNLETTGTLARPTD